MNRIRKPWTGLTVLCVFMLVVSLLAGCGADQSSDGITEFSDLKGKTVSMLTGAPFEELVRESLGTVLFDSSLKNLSVEYSSSY